MATTLLSLLFGALIGLTLGMVGGGGSILTVPILVYAIGQPVQQATTTSLAMVGLNALVGMVGHARAHRVKLRTGIAFGLVGIGGVRRLLAQHPGARAGAAGWRCPGMVALPRVA